MDEGDIEHLDKLSDKTALSNLESSCTYQVSTSVNKINELLRNTRTCTHTHTCNPPGPDAAHTHTCHHTHTQVFASVEVNKEHTNSKPRGPSGNRETVRKYREKQKAQTAYLEKEVKKLRLQNQQLLRRQQRQALLVAEFSRLRSILVDLKRKIDIELGAFPYKKQCISSTIFNERDAGGATGLRCQTNMPCYRPLMGSSSQVATCGNGKLMDRWEGNYQPALVDCQVNVDKEASAEEELWK